MSIHGDNRRIRLPQSKRILIDVDLLKHRFRTNELNAAHQFVHSVTSQDIFDDPFVHYTIHGDWLKDSRVIRTYRQAILDSRYLFRGKIVLDVNCGIGLLSMFAIRAGAKHVYAIDSSGAAKMARLIVNANNLADSITVIQGNTDDIRLPVDQVDIIVTMFRCDYHHYEVSLKAIIAARDKWLKPDGIMFPDCCHIHLAGINDGDLHRSMYYWNNVYDFDMHAIRRDRMAEPFLFNVEKKTIVTDQYRLKSYNFYTVTEADLESFDVMFRLKMQYGNNLMGVITFFELTFTKTLLPTSISMKSWAGVTSWLPRVFMWPHTVMCQKDNVIYGVFQSRSMVATTERHSQTFTCVICCTEPGNDDRFERLQFTHRLKH